jgi:hypothetical protein
MFRRIAELFFEKQLDEDFLMGLKEGKRVVKHDITFKLELAIESAPKSKQPGLAQALEIVKAHA